MAKIQMAKIHTHYDNLKVARMAPPEVIRAAYKALSQKYHPDKNPGDEKAARIMAILNTAYSTLSDTQRRKEHDEWISAEDWEIEWLESTKLEEQKERGSFASWDGNEVVPYRPSRDPKWWAILLACVGIGWFSGFLMFTQPEFLSVFGLPAEKSSPPLMVPVIAEPIPPKILESRVVAVSQFRLPEANPQCSGEPRSVSAPNGEAWPVQSGYIEGYKVGNLGGYTQLTIDNSHNASDNFVKLFDIEENQNVRYLLVKAHQKFTMEQLKSGNYEIRHQVLASENCDSVPALTSPALTSPSLTSPGAAPSTSSVQPGFDTN